MLSFSEFMTEHVLSIGINPKHEPYREKLRPEIHDILRKSYSGIGGYSGRPSGSEEESNTIHDDISNSLMKVVTRGGKVSSVVLYKPQFGRKAIAVGTSEGKKSKLDYRQIATDDIKHKRSWGEVSGAPEAIQKKLGAPVVPSNQAEKLLGKKVKIVNRKRYSRKIGNDEHEKVIMGYPKND